MDKTNTDSTLFMISESYLFGVFFPIVLAYTFTRIILFTPAILDDWFLLIWLVTVAIVYTGVGIRRSISTPALLSGGLAGWISVITGITLVIGFDRFSIFVLFLLMGAVPIVAGAWIAYEIRRRDETNTEPRVGTWRHVFVLTLAVLFGGSAPWLI